MKVGKCKIISASLPDDLLDVLKFQVVLPEKTEAVLHQGVIV